MHFSISTFFLSVYFLASFDFESSDTLLQADRDFNKARERVGTAGCSSWTDYVIVCAASRSFS
jgi:hypothetical protein